MHNILEPLYIIGKTPFIFTMFNCPTNSVSTGIVLISFAIIFFFFKTKSNSKIKVLGHSMCLDFLYDWFQQDIISITSLKKQRFFVFFYLIFFFILFSNVSGLIPFSMTVTTYWFVNLYFAFSIQIGITLVGCYFNNFNFIKVFLPSNIPWGIALLLVPTEVLSYISRILSLAIRLFANMFAGHTMLKIISCVTWGVLYLLAPSGFLIVLLPLAAFFLVLVLEILVSLLQAYVFISLVFIYIRLNLNLH